MPVWTWRLRRVSPWEGVGARRGREARTCVEVASLVAAGPGSSGMSTHTGTAALLQYVAQRLPPAAVAELRARGQRYSAADDGDDTSAFQLLSVTLLDARRVTLLKLGLFRRWRAHTQSRRRLQFLLERAQQLSDDRRMRSALSLWAASAFESRLSAVLLSRGLALCAVLLASAARGAVPGERGTVTTSTSYSTSTTSFATAVFSYGAALYHAQHAALVATAPARGKVRRLVPALRGSVAAAVDGQRLDVQRLRQQLAAALTAVRERDAWLRDLQGEHDAALEAARSTEQQLQQQADETEHWRAEARRWEEAHGEAQARLDDSKSLLQDSCAALERLQASELAYAMKLASAQSECQHLEAQLRAAGEASREAASVAASLTAERDALRESVAAARASAEAQLSVSEAGRAEAEEACHALRAALQGADSQAAAMLVAASADKAELVAQLEEAEARLRQMGAAQSAASEEMLPTQDGDAAEPPRPAAMSPQVLSRVLDRMALVHAQLERQEVDEQPPPQGESTTTASFSPWPQLADAVGEAHSSDATAHDTDEARAQLAALQTRCASLAAALEEVSATGLASASEVTALRSQLEDAHAALTQLALLQTRCASLQTRCVSLEAALGEASASGLASASEVTTLRSQLEDAHAALAQLAALQMRCALLEAASEEASASGLASASEVSALRSQLEDAHASLAQLAALQTRCASLEAALEEATASGSASASEVTTLRSQLEDAHAALAQLAALQMRCALLEAASEEASASGLASASEVSALRSQLEDAHASLAQLAALQTRCASLEAALEEATASGSASASEVSTLRSQLEDAHVARSQLQNLLDDALRSIAALEAHLADLAAKLAATEAARDAAAADALRATAEVARARMEVRLAKAAADKAQGHGVQAPAPDRPDVGPVPPAQLAELQAALADAEARAAALSREVDRFAAERASMAAQLRDASRKQTNTASRGDEAPMPAAEPSRQLDGVAKPLPSMVDASVDTRRRQAAQRLPAGKLEGVLWVRGPVADTPAPHSHGPPQFVWVKHAATLWSSGVLKLLVVAAGNVQVVGRNGHAGQEDQHHRIAGPGTPPSGLDAPAEVDLATCDDVVIASWDSYRHTSLRHGKRCCFHVIRPGGDLALAAACGNDAETREWADLLRLFIQQAAQSAAA